MYYSIKFESVNNVKELKFCQLEPGIVFIVIRNPTLPNKINVPCIPQKDRIVYLDGTYSRETENYLFRRLLTGEKIVIEGL